MPVPSARRRRRLLVAVVIVAALVVLTGVTELYLRLLLGLGNPIVVAPDAACAYIEAPNQHVNRFFRRVDIDRYGMRSGPFQPLPPPGTLRIMFFGDTLTYGTSRVSQSDLFTQILRRDLPAIVHQPVEVLNASARGWALANELAFARSRGLFHSAIVLLVLNDADPSQPRADLAGVVSEDTINSHPRTAIGELWSAYLKPWFLHLAARRDQGDMAESNPAMIQANLARLDQFQRLVTAAHARLAIVYLPFRADIPAPASASLAIFHQWAAAHAVPLFDLTAVEASQPPHAVARDGIHLNPSGNLLVARAIESQWPSVLGTK